MLLIESAFFVQASDLGEGTAQSTGRFLETDRTDLSLLIFDRKIPGSIFICFDNGIISTSKLTLLVSVVLGYLRGAIGRQIIIEYCIRYSTHCHAPFLP